MSQTPDSTGPTEPAGARKRVALGSMLIADLRSLAGGLGVPGAGSMKKAQLVEAIKASQSGSAAAGAAAGTAPEASTPSPEAGAADQDAAAPRVARRTRARAAVVTTEPTEPTGPTPAEAPEKAPEPVTESAGDSPAEPAPVVRTRTRSRSAGRPEVEQAPEAAPASPDATSEPQSSSQPERGEDSGAGRDDSGQGGRRRRGERAERQDGSEDKQGQDRQQGQDKQNDKQNDKQGQDKQRGPRQQRGQGDQQDRGDQGGKQGRQDQSARNEQQGRQDREQQAREDRSREQQARDDRAREERSREDRARNDRQARDDQNDADDLEGGGRNRRRRGRDRERNRPLGAGAQRNEPDTTILEDDVLVPAAGILDVLDNYAFVRTSGYLPGADDVYVSLSMVRRFGLRRGDALVGQVRQPREGERKEKFNPMVQIDTVNGNEPEASKNRVDFDRLTPLHPSERLRLETGPGNLVGRVIDVLAPIGKGQRGLVVSPRDAGKTELLRAVAGSVSANHPECHLMVVLLDERPEEVTDFERAVNGEVISSTFDRPPGDHTAVAELAIERAKRLVELGHDVVVLLDGITRLGRAYDLAAAAHGRELPGGLDAAALHPTKRFFGAARNLENGGSLTLLATAAVETGSPADAAILDALTDAGNLLVRLSGDLAGQRLHPAIDTVASGTRHEELLMSQEELAIVHKLRAELADLEPGKALGSLLERLRRTQTNIEFLMQVQRSS